MSYITQATISADTQMLNRVAQAAAEQGVTDAGLDPATWAREWARVWASAPGWADSWVAYTGPDPGIHAVTDGQILSQVQSMMPFTPVGGAV